MSENEIANAVKQAIKPLIASIKQLESDNIYLKEQLNRSVILLSDLNCKTDFGNSNIGLISSFSKKSKSSKRNSSQKKQNILTFFKSTYDSNPELYDEILPEKTKKQIFEKNAKEIATKKGNGIKNFKIKLLYEYIRADPEKDKRLYEIQEEAMKDEEEYEEVILPEDKPKSKKEDMAKATKIIKVEEVKNDESESEYENEDKKKETTSKKTIAKIPVRDEESEEDEKDENEKEENEKEENEDEESEDEESEDEESEEEEESEDEEPETKKKSSNAKSNSPNLKSAKLSKTANKKPTKSSKPSKKIEEPEDPSDEE
jgi:hypothetical protein